MKGLLPDGLNTYAGLIVTLAPTLLGWFGYAPTPEFNGQFAAEVAAWVTLGGAVYTAFGKARHQIPLWFKKI